MESMGLEYGAWGGDPAPAMGILAVGEPPGDGGIPASSRGRRSYAGVSIGGVVYLVCSDANLRSSLLWLFSAAGYQVEVCGHADAAIDFDDEKQNACVVMDVGASPAQGVALLERLAASRGLPPVVLLTGYAEPLVAVGALSEPTGRESEGRPFDIRLLERVGVMMADCDRRRALRRAAAAFAVTLPGLPPRLRRIIDAFVAGQPDDVVAAELRTRKQTLQAERARLLRELGIDSRADLLRVLLELEGGHGS